MEVFLYPLGWIYRAVTGTRNWFYDHRWMRAVSVEVPVISVGNITAGGTGKTPVSLALLETIQKRGHTCGVVTRGYGRASKGVLRVAADDAGQPIDAGRFGDEPTLIKTTFPQMPVFVGEKRVAAARTLLSDQPVDIILCDDAFQHRRLHRDLNILLLDASEDMKRYRMLPVGRAREALLPALRRADFCVLTKTNLIAEAEHTRVREWLKAAADKPIVEAKYVVRVFHSEDGRDAAELTDDCLLVTGIAKPESVSQILEGRAKVVKHKIFSDHHRYTHLEVEAMMDELSQLSARWIVTTAKDAVKLRRFSRLRGRLWTIELGIELIGETEELFAAMDRLVRPRGELGAIS